MRISRNRFALGVLLLCLVGFAQMRASMESSLIYPGAASRGQAYAMVAPSVDYDLVPLHLRDGTRIIAQFGRALDPDGAHLLAPAPRPTVIFFYGNGACIANMAEQFNGFRRLGLNVIIPEYPGYGMSEGKPSEKGLYETAEVTREYVSHRPDVDPAHIIAAGWSMGAAMAVSLASRQEASALVTISAFTTLPAVAHAVMPWFPTSLIIRSKFDNLGRIPSVTCPIFMAHGTKDQLVPPPMADALAAAAKASVTQFWVPGAGHNDVFAVGGPRLWEAIRAFLSAQE
jgi:fermentation-respiration switch protein FrsA (DUF1100 family)